MASGRRMARGPAIGLAAVVLVAGAILGLGYAVLQTPAGRSWLAAELEQRLSTPGETEVGIEGLAGSLPLSPTVARIEVRDRAGPWLVIEALQVDVALRDLIAGTVNLRILKAGRVALDRLPEAAPEDEAAAGGVPAGGLPVPVRVQRLEIDEVRLGAAVLGEPAAFRVAGEAASPTGAGVQAALRIERTDGIAGTIEARADYDLQDQTLALDVTAHEPAGGMIVRALSIDGHPALDLGLSGAGPLSAWEGTLTVKLDGLVEAESRLALKRADAVAFAVEGSAETARPLAELPWSLLAGRTSFAANGAWRAPGLLEIEAGRVMAPAVDLELAGSLDTRAAVVEARAQARLKDPAALRSVLPGSDLQDLTLSTETSGPLDRPRVSLDLEAASVAAPGLTAEEVTASLGFIADEAPADAGAGRFTTTGRAERVVLHDLADEQSSLGERLAWNLEGRLDLAGNRLEAERLTLETGTLALSGRGGLALDTGAGEAHVEVTYPELAALDVLLGLGIEGRATLAGTVASETYAGPLEAELTGGLEDLTTPDPALRALLAPRADLVARLRMEAETGFSVRDLALTSPAARLTGGLRADPDFTTMTADYTLDVGDLAVLAPAVGAELAGTATLSGRAEGDPSDLRLDGEVEARNARLEDLRAERLLLRYTAEDLEEGPRGRLEATLDSALGALDATSTYAFDDQALRLDALTLAAQGLEAEGTAAIPLSGAPLTLNLAGRTETFAPWLTMAGLSGDGRGRFELTLSPDGPRQPARLEAEVEALSVAVAEDSALRAARATAEVTTPDLWAEPAMDARLDARDVTLDELVLASLEANFDGTAGGGRVELRGTGEWRGELGIDAAAEVARRGQEIDVKIARLTGRALARDTALLGPAQVTWRPGALEVAELELAFGEARLTLDGGVGPERLSATLDVRGLPLDALRPLAALPAQSGTADLALALAGSPEAPRGDLRLEVRDLAIEAVPDAPAVQLALDGTWQDGRVRADGRLSGLAEKDASLALDLPLVLDAATWAPNVPVGEPVSGRLGWSGPVDPLWALVPVDAHLLSGTGKVEVALAGTVARPRLNGSVILSQGRYENLETGTVLTGVELTAELDGDRLRLTRMTAGDGGEGTLTASGSMDLSAPAYPAEIAADLRSLTVVRRDEITAASSGRLTFDGSIDGGTLAGELATDAIELRVPDRLPPQVVDLDVVEATADEAGAAAGMTESDAPPPFELAFDLDIEIPRRAFVRGRGLDTEWAGRLQVTGTAEAPVVEGELRLVRGQVSALGKSFELNKGTISFLGGETLDPVLDIEATRQTGDLSVTVAVAGPVSNPQISFTSAPPLPQDEIIARVLFGKQTTQLSAVEAAQLASAAAELSGAGGPTGGVLDRVRQTLHVDVLRFESSEESGTATPGVATGKYLTEDVYIGATQGTEPESGSAEVEVELTPNISVESEVGRSGQSRTGIKFKWDY